MKECSSRWTASSIWKRAQNAQGNTRPFTTLSRYTICSHLFKTKCYFTSFLLFISQQPVQLVLNSFPVCKGPGKLPAGTTEIPFAFPLLGNGSRQLYETYHGVYINIQYFIKVDMKRGLLAKDLDKSCEFIVEYSVQTLFHI